MKCKINLTRPLPHATRKVIRKSTIRHIPSSRIPIQKNSNAEKRTVLVIREAFMPLKQSHLIGRPVEDLGDLRELMIEFGAAGYLALYRFESSLDVVTILAIKHQREDDYK